MRVLFLGVADFALVFAAAFLTGAFFLLAFFLVTFFLETTFLVVAFFLATVFLAFDAERPPDFFVVDLVLAEVFLMTRFFGDGLALLDVDRFDADRVRVPLLLTVFPIFVISSLRLEILVFYEKRFLTDSIGCYF